MMVGNFFYDNEQAFVFGLGYDFKQIAPGLSAEAFYAKGDGFRDGKGEKLKEHETDFILKYKFQSLALDGLAFTFKYADYSPKGRMADGKSLGNSTKESRVYLDYRLKVF